MMNTTDIIYEIARRSQQTRMRLTRREIAHTIDLLLDVMVEELVPPHGEIRLRNFGSFHIRERKYSGGMLKQGSDLVSYQHPPDTTYYTIKFQASRRLIERIRKSK